MSEQNAKQAARPRRISWGLFAFAPIAAFLTISVWLVINSYSGHCGLLDAGSECSKTQYVFEALLNPLTLPAFLIDATTWLLLVGLTAFAVETFRHRREAAPPDSTKK